MMLVSVEPSAEVNAKAELETTATRKSWCAVGKISCDAAFDSIFDTYSIPIHDISRIHHSYCTKIQ